MGIVSGNPTLERIARGNALALCATGAKRAVHEPVAHSASPLSLAMRSNVGSPLTMPIP